MQQTRPTLDQKVKSRVSLRIGTLASDLKIKSADTKYRLTPITARYGQLLLASDASHMSPSSSLAILETFPHDHGLQRLWRNVEGISTFQRTYKVRNAERQGEQHSIFRLAFIH